MRSFDSLLEAFQAVRDYTIDKPERCPADIFEQLRVLWITPPDWDAVLQTIYFAPRGIGDETTVGPELMQIAAGALMVFAAQHWNEIGKDGTAAKMAKALRRDAGEPAPEGSSWPDPADDPVRIVIPEPPAPPAG